MSFQAEASAAWAHRRRQELPAAVCRACRVPGAELWAPWAKIDGKICGKTWENVWKNFGKSGENLGKFENLGEHLVKIWGKSMQNRWENLRKNRREILGTYGKRKTERKLGKSIEHPEKSTKISENPRIISRKHGEIDGFTWKIMKIGGFFLALTRTDHGMAIFEKN